jgi:DnaJ-class molecular chaperone
MKAHKEVCDRCDGAGMEPCKTGYMKVTFCKKCDGKGWVKLFDNGKAGEYLR